MSAVSVDLPEPPFWEAKAINTGSLIIIFVCKGEMKTQGGHIAIGCHNPFIFSERPALICGDMGRSDSTIRRKVR